jgi:thiol-disulfide isomerase/thioredoxin
MNTWKMVVGSMLLLVAVSVGVAQQKAPNFSYKTASGETIDLSKLQGKVVVVNFWATWCGPCRREIPDMIEVYNAYKSKGLEIVGVSLDKGGWKDVTPVVKKMNIPYPVVLDEQSIAGKFGDFQYIPTTFFVDRKGNIASMKTGMMTKEEFEKKVKELL